MIVFLFFFDEVYRKLNDLEYTSCLSMEVILISSLCF